METQSTAGNTETAISDTDIERDIENRYVPPYDPILSSYLSPVISYFNDEGAWGHWSTVLDDLLTTIEEKIRDGTLPEPAQVQSICEEAITALNNGSGDIEDCVNILASLSQTADADFLGLLYEQAEYTSDTFNQYFTPTHVAATLGVYARQTAAQTSHDPLSESDISGRSTLNMFGDTNETVPELPEDGRTVVVEPACGSGRLGLVQSRHLSSVTYIGFELDHRLAKIAALSAVLRGHPALILAGDAISGDVRTCFISRPQAKDGQQFISLDGSGWTAPSLLDGPSDPIEDTTLPPVSDLTTLEDVDGFLQSLRDRHADITVSNPPFTKIEADNWQDKGPLSPTDYAVAHRQVDRENSVKKSTKAVWLMYELASNITHPDGGIAFIVSQSEFSSKGDRHVREWLLESDSKLRASVSLPPVTFEPATSTGTGILAAAPRPSSHRNKDLNYEIHMAIAETVGHDGQRELIHTPDDENPPLLHPVGHSFYEPLHWDGITATYPETVDQNVVLPTPDDELPGLCHQYHEHLSDL